MQIDLHHHVFSSDGGYKTLFASSGLPKVLVDELESFSRRAYTRLKGPPIRPTLRLRDGSLCESRIFSAGADHTGRPRTCVASPPCASSIR